MLLQLTHVSSTVSVKASSNIFGDCCIVTTICNQLTPPEVQVTSNGVTSTGSIKVPPKSVQQFSS